MEHIPRIAKTQVFMCQDVERDQEDRGISFSASGLFPVCADCHCVGRFKLFFIAHLFENHII